MELKLVIEQNANPKKQKRGNSFRRDSSANWLLVTNWERLTL